MNKVKRFMLPKIEKVQNDYKLWGLSIPKLPNGHMPHIINRNRPRNDMASSVGAIKPSAVSDGDSSAQHLRQQHQLEAPEAEPPKIDDAADQRGECEPDQFADLVFSFFSNNDHHYVVHRSGNNYSEPQSRERCESADAGNDYEIMSPKMLGEESNGTRNTQSKQPKLHKSELTFYVSAASLKGSNGSITNITASNYDLPLSSPARRRSSSIFITQHKSLNDLNEKDDQIKYQNSASLDNLSQVCNISLKHADSKRSITSLPELATIKRKTNNPFPKIAAALKPKSPNREYSSYFDNDKAVRLKNRISAIYTSKSFKGKKRFSKAWCGFKEWLDTEKSKLDGVIHKAAQKKTQNPAAKSSDDYPESDFSEYEDVDEPNASFDSFTRDEDACNDSVTSEKSSKLDRKGSRSRSVCNSVFKLNLLRDSKVIHINDGDGSLRHSRSQPSVLLISEPVLVKINCENVNQDTETLEETSIMSVGSACSGSECTDSVANPSIAEQHPNDQSGFAELKAIVKAGSAACKELFAILQQRAESERQYACGILRVGARARRAARGNAAASLISKKIAVDMESRAQTHREFSNRLIEEIVRPLQRLVSTRDAVRKQVERDVGITARRLADLRTSEARCKKLSHGAARFNERIQDTILPSGSTSSQEIDLRKKKTKSEEAASKSDVEYYMACLRAERARVELETTISKGSETLIELEEERLTTMKRSLKKYITLAASLKSGSILDEAVDLEDNFEVAINSEIRLIQNLVIQPLPSMHLPDFYCQHVTLAMNKERRSKALLRILQMIKADMERERKSKQVLEKLSQAITATPNFGANDSQQSVMEKLYQMRSIITYLEGTRVQAMANLATFAGQSCVPHPLSPHLKVVRDRHGLQQTILTVPPWLHFEYKAGINRDRATNSPPSSPPTPGFTTRFCDRGAADGVSIQHYSDIDDSLTESPPPPERPPPPKLSYEKMDDSQIIQSV